MQTLSLMFMLRMMIIYGDEDSVSSIKAFRKVGTEGALSKVQDNIDMALTPLLNAAITDGILLVNIPLASGLTQVEHRLGRPLKGWIITRQRANASVWDTQDTNSKASKTLALNASTAVTVDLWVF